MGPSERDKALAPRRVSSLTRLYKVRAYNRVHRWDAEQHHCPGCGQNYDVYQRNINNSGARVLVEMANITDEMAVLPRRAPAPLWIARSRLAGIPPWIHVPSMITKRLPDVSHDYLSFWWGLMVEECVLRPDGGRAGWWRITHLGMDFVDDMVKIEKYVVLCNKEILGFDGPLVTIHDALGTKFDLRNIRRRGD